MRLNQRPLVHQQIRQHGVGEIEKVNKRQMLHLGSVFHEHVHKRNQRQSQHAHTHRGSTVKRLVKLHQLLLLFDVAIRDRPVQGVSDCRARAKLGQRKHI